MEQQHVHIIGICGTAMASLAGFLKQRGFKVTGSDAAAYPPMSDFLASIGIPILQPYSEANLKPRPDMVIVGNAISRGNPELEYVLEERILLRSMPDILFDLFMRTRQPIVVAGTHGKTTTTSMLAWIFQSAGKDPSFLIGGIAENFGSSFALRQGKHFIIEGDEYDTAFFDKGPKFLHYFPHSIILTSVEFDHADIYDDLDAVKTSFKRLVNLVPRKGRIIAYDGNENVDECVDKAFCPVEKYGMKEGSFWRIMNLNFEPQRTTWTVLRDGTEPVDFEFALAGEYNVLNATAAAAMAANFGIDPPVIVEALKSFKSVKRRLEIKAEIDGITIIDDFAHHPTAIAATLTALRVRYPGARLWAIFEPRSNTLRRRVMQKELINSLAAADQVIVTPIFKPEAVPEDERLTTSSVVNGIKRQGKSAREMADADAIVEAITPELESGDVVAILSNGGFGGIYEKLPRKLEELRGVQRT
ncbi:MAG TPA: UDP-N-acetylmuramate:L-alanyl-gamma-D-glutamyl-meso-diaminopimelate ligase [Candidatus Angelobacter sp.]|nr:UDP-N-acetylmuramate:L-alanyl-gamma-D-glutamyl-meso-diaminopimelate ligase [Candidatus Angelobacter sp.]